MPLHVQLIITLTTGSVMLCLSLGLFGFIFSKSRNALPPVPQFPGSSFPGPVAHVLAVLFGIFFALGGVSSYTNEEAQITADINLLELILNAALQVLFYLPFIIIYLSLPSRQNPPVPCSRKLAWVLFFLFLMLIPSQLMELLKLQDWIAEMTGAPVLQDVVTTIRDGDFNTRIVMVIMAVIVAPITEEIYFRGFVYNILKKWSGVLPAAIASSFFFSIVHTSLTQAIPLFLFAMVQCWAYEKARSLWLPITLHMLFNGISCLAILFLMQ
jgi:membrane protease YdiL (CAAX protease family)